MDCANTCPVTPPPGHVACPVDHDAAGCPMAATFVPEPKCGETIETLCPRSNDATGCPVSPMCGPDQMLCYPMPAPNTESASCPPVGWCMDSWTRQPNGDKCPNVCPTAPLTCPEGETVCPIDHTAEGCPMPQTCSGPVAEGGDPMANCPQTHDPQGCPITAGPPPELPAGTECPVCPEPTPCPEGQMPCTSPAPPVKMCTDPATGCWPLSCPVQTCVDAFVLSAKPVTDGEPVQCPNMCPIEPPPGQVACPADYNPEGCPMPTMYVELTCGETLESKCVRTHDPTGCPATPSCGPDQMVCHPTPAATDDTCPPVGWCQDMFIPGGAPGKKCPAACPTEPVTCQEGEVPCPVDYSPDGCPMPMTCSDVAANCPMTHDPQGCPITTFA